LQTTITVGAYVDCSFKQSIGTNKSIQMTSGLLLERELKKKDSEETPEIKESYLCHKAAQDLSAKC
jgi:hypothetical protein